MTRISISAVHNADVLLYCGTSPFSRLIELWDDSRHSHAGLYIGRYLRPNAGEEAEVAEALLREGVVARPLRLSIADSSGVQAYRLKRGLENPAPVLAVARGYLAQHERYAVEEVLLLAVLCLVRRVPATPVLAELLRRVFDAAAERVADIFRNGKEPMICSEFVFRCYQEANVNISARAAVIRGVEPGSLLARLRARGKRPAYAELGLDAEAARKAMEPGAERTAASLPELAGRYLAEAAKTRAARSQGEPELDASAELRHSVERLAAQITRLDGQKRHDEAMARFYDGADNGGLLESLGGYVADFVTPGDLERCPDFALVGDVK